MEEKVDSVILNNHADSLAAHGDTLRKPSWTFETLPEVPGMYQLDSLPQLKHTNTHKTLVWKDVFEDYVKQTKYYHPELPAVRNGVIGEPIDYTISNDSYLSLAFILLILVSIVTVVRSWRFTKFQLSNLFRTPRENSAELRETSDQLRYQTFFYLQGILIMGLMSFAIAQESLKDGEDFALDNYQMIGLFCLVAFLYRIICKFLNKTVLPLYFDKSKRRMWYITRLFLIGLQGALLLPVALLYFYFHLNLETSLTAIGCVIGVTLLLRLGKAYAILFSKDSTLINFLVYVCTMTIVPLSLMIGTSIFIAYYLKINI